MGKPWDICQNTWRFEMRSVSDANKDAQHRVCQWLATHGDPPQLAAVPAMFCGVRDGNDHACLREDGHDGPHCSAVSHGRWYWIILDIF